MSTVSKIKKGNNVIMVAFTGMKLGVFEVVATDKDTITVGTNSGERVFSKETGKQIEPEPKAPRFASSIIPDDGSYVPPTRKKAKPKDNDDEEDEKPVKKTKHKVTKKSKPDKVVENDDDFDDDDFDDDDFEEVE